MPVKTPYVCENCGSLISLEKEMVPVYRKAKLYKKNNVLKQCPYCIKKDITVLMEGESQPLLNSSGRLQSRSDVVKIKRKKRPLIQSRLTKDELYWFPRFRRGLEVFPGEWGTDLSLQLPRKFMPLDRALLETLRDALKKEASPESLTEIIDSYELSEFTGYFPEALKAFLREQVNCVCEDELSEEGAERLLRVCEAADEAMKNGTLINLDSEEDLEEFLRDTD